MDSSVVEASASSSGHDECRPVEVTRDHFCEFCKACLWIDPEMAVSRRSLHHPLDSNDPHSCYICHRMSRISLCSSHFSYMELWCDSCKESICPKNYYAKHQDCKTMHVDEKRKELVNEGEIVYGRLYGLYSRYKGDEMRIDDWMKRIRREQDSIVYSKNLIKPPLFDWISLMTQLTHRNIEEIKIGLDALVEIESRTVGKIEEENAPGLLPRNCSLLEARSLEDTNGITSPLFNFPAPGTTAEGWSAAEDWLRNLDARLVNHEVSFSFTTTQDVERSAPESSSSSSTFGQDVGSSAPADSTSSSTSVLNEC